MPHREGQGRLIAPDLIGMGDSEKLGDFGPDTYRRLHAMGSSLLLPPP